MSRPIRRRDESTASSGVREADVRCAAWQDVCDGSGILLLRGWGVPGLSSFGVEARRGREIGRLAPYHDRRWWCGGGGGGGVNQRGLYLNMRVGRSFIFCQV